METILDPSTKLELGKLLETILPNKQDSYTLHEIDQRLHEVIDKVEELERHHNDRFDETIDKNSIDYLDSLYRNLHSIQLDVMKLQCDIAFTREQYDSMNTICDNAQTRERRELKSKEANLRRSLQQFKFEPLKEYFKRLTDYLISNVDICRKLCSQQATCYHQLFDWKLYYKIMSLIRACGKALSDVVRFEKLYQSDVDIRSMNFKQTLEQMDLNNFIELEDSYSLESQLELTLPTNQKSDLKYLLTNTDMFNSVDDIGEKFLLFDTEHIKLKSITVDCCRLLVDLNMNYIEAHLTDGINIDRLNGVDATSVSQDEEQTLPLYAFSPQEYITQIGQHLLTLRKQTEQFENIDNSSFRQALGYLNIAQNVALKIENYKTITEIILRCVARHCIRSLLARTNKSILSQLTLNGKRQLSTDALYLDNVLEDLNLLDSSEPNAEKFKSLLV